MNVLNKNINNIFFIFALSHLMIWVAVPTFTNNNLPLDTIEALAWGSNLDWGFNKHPPMSAFFSEIFYQIFGAKDWVFYLLSQIFVLIAFYYVFKLAYEILRNAKLSLISVFFLESIYFYNFTTTEFNVNVCQLPFWSLVVYYSWKIYETREIKFIETTIELSNIIQRAIKRTGKTHPATKSFQAIRIHVNNELHHLRIALSKLEQFLKLGGIVVIISFHSLEDRIVKNFFKPEITDFPKDIPINPSLKQTYRCIKKKVRPSIDEIKNNPRSRSAVMRVFSRL